MAQLKTDWGQDVLYPCMLLVLYFVQATADVIVTSPDNSTMTVLSMPSSFGYAIPEEGLTGYLVNAQPSLACDTIAPPPNISAIAFALIERGNCEFDKKVLIAQLAGYQGAIVYNDQNNAIFPMTGDEYASRVIIPSVFVGRDGGLNLMKCDYEVGATVTLMPYRFSTAYLIYFYAFLSVIILCLILPAIYGIAKFVRDRRRLCRIRLSKDHLKKLPIIKFKKGDNRYDVCAICLDDYEDGNKLRVLPCQHAFHCKCIDPWLTNNRRTCPICKRKVVPPGTPDSDEESDTSVDENTPLLGGTSSGPSSPNRDESQWGAVGGQQDPCPEVVLDPPVSESYDSGIANNGATDREDDGMLELSTSDNPQGDENSQHCHVKVGSRAEPIV